jgi:multiple antibiotic resistance protein
VVAAVVIATFALFGQQILLYLGISVPSLQVAGGLLLLVIALDLPLRFAGLLQRMLGQAGIGLITRISGLLLSAIAVQLVVDAVREFARAGL